MKKNASKKPAGAVAATPAAPPADRLPWIVLLASVLLGFAVYSPASRGPFLFDDLALPMNDPRIQGDIAYWIGSTRPVLMLSYWLNYSISATATASYHSLNVLLHAACATLVFIILRKLLTEARLALLGTAIFLLHPVQTEVVAYVAGRSESLSALFYLGAFAIFVTRREPEIGWTRTGAVVLLFVGALLSKEHTVTLPALLLLTDLYFNPGSWSFGGAKKNWRLYVPLAIGAVLGAVAAFRVMSGGTTAGFGAKGLSWTSYLFTQFRVIFDYLRLFVAPFGLNADYDYPLSKSILDHGAILGLAGIVAIAAAAVIYRNRFPVASYGVLVFFLILLPTSSIVPIQDPIAERRLYLPMIGLLLAALDLARRAPVAPKAVTAGFAAIAVLFAGTTFVRAADWGDALRIWEDTAAKSPNKARTHFQLGYAKYALGRCAEAGPHYQRVYEIEGPTERLLVDWALALSCANQEEAAIEKAKEAIKTEPTAHAWATLGMLYGRGGRATDARGALDEALKADPNFDMTYVYIGNLAIADRNGPEAIRWFEEAVRRNPSNKLAQQTLDNLRSAQQQQ